MKTSTKITACFMGLAVFALTASSAQATSTNIITVALTAETQSAPTDDSTTTTTPVPGKFSLKTVDILNDLAQDEHAEGNYGATTFPAGAVLVVIDSSNNPPVFQVLTSSNQFLVDVSDIISASGGTYGADLNSGKQTDATGLASPKLTDTLVMTISYDDHLVLQLFGNRVGLQFALTGLMVNTVNDTKPNGANVYTETRTSKMAKGIGDGISSGQPILVTGSITASSKVTKTLP